MAVFHVQFEGTAAGIVFGAILVGALKVFLKQLVRSSESEAIRVGFGRCSVDGFVYFLIDRVFGHAKVVALTPITV